MNSLFNSIIVGSCILLLAACQPAVEQIETVKTESSVGMLQHNVYFYLKDDVTAEEKQQFEEGLKELLKIEEIHKAELGTPAATEERDVTDNTYAYTIFTWFKTMDDYNVYADHPDHLKFIEKYKGLWADVRVYDAELIDHES